MGLETNPEKSTGFSPNELMVDSKLFDVVQNHIVAVTHDISTYSVKLNKKLNTNNEKYRWNNHLILSMLNLPNTKKET